MDYKYIFYLQVRFLSSKNEKIIDLSYSDIDPVYVPIKKEIVDEQDLQIEDQHSINSVCFYD